ncbi:hypothetical protein KJ657_01070 [Patescibacteria group bacterium]|nr:hypothetical protein [Patescibacteria group bacterium]MBU1015658.1 hypothetical protein [Patescibacteria group bacterium]MBU1684767.1 hypothetical protein [Patescibacteria group bacterium]MBU1938201.1 hypothetical protein [Patescibacteria group bacterium]
MSNQSSEAQDIKQAEAAKERESDIRELKPLPGTDEAKAVREELQSLVEVKELPSIEKAMETVPTIEGLKELYQYAKECKRAKLIHIVHFAKSKWKAIPNNKSEDVEASQALADLINEKRKAFVARHQGRENNEDQAEENGEKNEDIYTELTDVASNAKTLDDLTKVVAHCREFRLLEVTGDRKRWHVKGLAGNEKSQKLAQAINSKKDKFLKEIRITRQRINEVLEQIEHTPSSEELDKLVWELHERKRLVKEFTGLNSSDWVAHPIKGLQGSREVCDTLNKRREELVKSEEKAARARLTKKVS